MASSRGKEDGIAAARQDHGDKHDVAWLKEIYPFQSRTLTLDGVRVHYLDEGDGPPLLLLSNSPVWSFIYRRIILGLRGRFRCIAPDLPGFGLSDAPAEGAPTLARQSEFVDRFIAALRLSGVTLMVHALAGPPGLAALARRPERFRALIVCNTFVWPMKGLPRGMIKMLGSWLGRLLIVNFDLFARAVPGSGIRRALSPAERRAYQWVSAGSAYRRRQHQLMRSLSGSRGWLAGLEPKLTGLPLPALLLWGEHDNGKRFGFQERFKKIFPHHRAGILEGGGHFAPEDVPEAIVREIEDWWQAEVAPRQAAADNQESLAAPALGNRR